MRQRDRPVAAARRRWVADVCCAFFFSPLSFCSPMFLRCQVWTSASGAVRAPGRASRTPATASVSRQTHTAAQSGSKADALACFSFLSFACSLAHFSVCLSGRSCCRVFRSCARWLLERSRRWQRSALGRQRLGRRHRARRYLHVSSNMRTSTQASTSRVCVHCCCVC